MGNWFVYMLRCADGSLYTGVTTDIDRRLEEHNGKHGRGAKYLKGKTPLQLVWKLSADDRSQAQRLEYKIKQLTRTNKQRLIQGDASIHFQLGIPDHN